MENKKISYEMVEEEHETINNLISTINSCNQYAGIYRLTCAEVSKFLNAAIEHFELFQEADLANEEYFKRSYSIKFIFEYDYEVECDMYSDFDCEQFEEYIKDFNLKNVELIITSFNDTLMVSEDYKMDITFNEYYDEIKGLRMLNNLMSIECFYKFEENGCEDFFNFIVKILNDYYEGCEEKKSIYYAAFNKVYSENTYLVFDSDYLISNFENVEAIAKKYINEIIYICRELDFNFNSTFDVCDMLFFAFDMLAKRILKRSYELTK